jgi:hypothetical protein
MLPGEAREAHGGPKGGRLILLEWDSLEKARQFGQSDDLRNTMQRAGVVGKPEVYFLEELERPVVRGSCWKGLRVKSPS